VEIDNLHALNMDSLDELTRKLKQSMAVLDVTEEEPIMKQPIDMTEQSPP